MACSASVGLVSLCHLFFYSCSWVSLETYNHIANLLWSGKKNNSVPFVGNNFTAEILAAIFDFLKCYVLNITKVSTLFSSNALKFNSSKSSNNFLQLCVTKYVLHKAGLYLHYIYTLPEIGLNWFSALLNQNVEGYSIHYFALLFFSTGEIMKPWTKTQ